MIAFSTAKGAPKAVGLAWTDTSWDTQWYKSFENNRLTIDFEASVAVPDTLFMRVLKRKSAALSRVRQMLCIDTIGAGVVDMSGAGHGRTKLPTDIPADVDGYSVSIDIDPDYEYCVQFIKTGAGAVEVLAEFNFTR